MTVATILAYALAAYAAVGACVALAFVIFGLTQVAPASYTIGARLLIAPGAFALWPYVLRRWLAAGRAR